MRLRRLSNFFTVTGVVVGSIAVIGYAFDLVPELPQSVLKLVIYKLTFIGALGLVIFGAIIGRLARKNSGAGEETDGAGSSALLPGPVPDGMGTHAMPSAEAAARTPASTEP